MQVKTMSFLLTTNFCGIKAPNPYAVTTKPWITFFFDFPRSFYSLGLNLLFSCLSIILTHPCFLLPCVEVTSESHKLVS
jgi:hypothetical protein